jgi:hypothetical protein
MDDWKHIVAFNFELYFKENNKTMANLGQDDNQYDHLCRLLEIKKWGILQKK